MNGPTNSGRSRPTFGGATRGPAGGGGAFPGFGVANQRIGPSTGGVAATAARSDHQHPTIECATLAVLALVSAATMNAGTYAYVATLKCWFKLEPSTQTAVTAVRVAALGKAGYLWLREAISPAWWSQLTWYIGTAASDPENDGAAIGTPIPPQEYNRRHRLRWLPGTETASVTVNLTADLGANDYIQADWDNSFRSGDVALTVQGTVTVLTGTITITAATAINRATNTRNTITTDKALTVGRIIRLVATPTTTAVVMEDLGGNQYALSEQSVNGVLGAGFTNGQIIELVRGTTIPGATSEHGPNFLLIQDCDINVGTGAVRVNSGPNAIASLNRCYVHVSTSIRASTIRTTATSFHGAFAFNLEGNLFADLTTTVNVTVGLSLSNASYRQHLASHMSQGPVCTLQHNCYMHVSGTGSANVGVFGLAAGQIGFDVLERGWLNAGNAWGSGNNATSIFVRLAAGAGFSGPIPGTSNYVWTGGVALSGAVGSIPALNTLPHTIGPGQQPGSRVSFTGSIVTSAIGASNSYLANPGAALAVANLAAQRYAISEVLALRLRVTKLAGAVVTNNVTCTLYKNNVATTMLVTLLAADAANTKYVDSAHPILFVNGDDLDLRLDDAGADVLAGTLPVSAQVEFAG